MWKITPDSQLIELPADARASGVVWVPTEVLVFACPKLPPGRRKLWRQTAPFALEEDLIESIETLHFALGPPREEGVPVAVVSRRRMDEWLRLLSAEGVAPRVMLPDVYALPLDDGRRVVWHEGERCIYRAAEHAGFAGGVEWIASLAALQDRGGAFDVYGGDPEALPQAWRDGLRPPLAPLDQMMARADTGDAINLLQGEYSVKSGAAAWVRPWRWAAALALVLLGAHLATLVIETRWFDARAGEFRADSARVFESLRIDGELVDLRAQVERRLLQLEERRTKSDGNTWKLMAAIEKPLSECKSCRVDVLDLTQREILIEVSLVGNPQQLKRVLEQLPNADATHQDLPADKGRTRLRFQIRPRS